jgi:two-component sensor histidine kinase
MAFHELGTNAIKYGALSVPKGRVVISWEFDDDGDTSMLDLYWREEGGPPVTEPTHKGFGSRLIEQAFAQTASHVARVEYLPEGIEFHVRLGLADRLSK